MSRLDVRCAWFPFALVSFRVFCLFSCSRPVVSSMYATCFVALVLSALVRFDGTHGLVTSPLGSWLSALGLFPRCAHSLGCAFISCGDSSCVNFCFWTSRLDVTCNTQSVCFLHSCSCLWYTKPFVCTTQLTGCRVHGFRQHVCTRF